jgi:hypothetical protein
MREEYQFIPRRKASVIPSGFGFIQHPRHPAGAATSAVRHDISCRTTIPDDAASTELDSFYNRNLQMPALTGFQICSCGSHGSRFTFFRVCFRRINFASLRPNAFALNSD